MLLTSASYLFPCVFLEAIFVSLRLEFVHEQVHVVIAVVLNRRRRHFQLIVFISSPNVQVDKGQISRRITKKSLRASLMFDAAEPDVYACTSAVRRGKRSVRKHEQILITVPPLHSEHTEFPQYLNIKTNTILIKVYSLRPVCLVVQF